MSYPTKFCVNDLLLLLFGKLKEVKKYYLSKNKSKDRKSKPKKEIAKPISRPTNEANID
jgi:hypothetical protein